MKGKYYGAARRALVGAALAAVVLWVGIVGTGTRLGRTISGAVYQGAAREDESPVCRWR